MEISHKRSVPLTDKQKKLLLAWAHELETTDAEQTEGVLFGRVSLDDKPGFCCLGIMCNLKDPTAWCSPDGTSLHKDFWEWGEYSARWPSSESRLHEDFPPVELLAEYGLTKTPPEALGDLEGLWWEQGSVEWLAHLNDGGHSFAEIATVIREWVDSRD